jgi:hypothetical protein
MFATKAISQVEFSIETGNPVSLPKGEFLELMDFDEQFYYFLRLNDKAQFVFNTDEPPAIEVYNKQFNHVRSIPLLPGSDAKVKKTDPVAFYKVDSGFVFLVKTYSALTNLMKSYLFKTDENGRLIGEILSPVEVNDVTPGFSDYQFFQLNRVYQNGLPALVLSVKTPPEMDIPERVNLLVFDTQLTRTSERLINFPDDYLNYKFSDLFFGNSGMVFFRVEITNPFLMDKTVHQLVVYDVFTEIHQSLEFKFAEGEISRCDLVKIDDKMMGFFGYFTQNEEDKQISGVFYYLFNSANGSLINHNICPLSDEVVERFNPKNLDSKSDFQHLIPAGMHITRSNQVVLLFEYNWRSIMLIRDQEGKVFDQPVYNANEVFVLEFDNLDRFQHLLVIPKEQTNGYSRKGLGIVSQVNGENVFVLYNDHPKNINQYDPAKLKTMKMDYEGVLTTCSLLDSGYEKNRILLSGFPVKLDLTSVFSISDSTLLFLQRNEGVSLVGIKFNAR